MPTELITIATDTTPIDGAYNTPDSASASGGALLMHGQLYEPGSIRAGIRVHVVVERIGVLCRQIMSPGGDANPSPIRGG